MENFFFRLPLRHRAGTKSCEDILAIIWVLITLSSFTAANSAQDYEFQIEGGGNFGVLKIKSEGDWYNVCPDVFDSKAAELVCKELGYSYLCKKRELDVHDTEASNEAVLSAKLECGRFADDVADCEWQNLSLPSSCFNRTRHTILTCANETDVDLRLVGGAIPSEGIPQLRCSPNDTWSMLCGGLNWDIRDCRIICKQLGYTTCTNWYNEKDLYNLTDVDTIFTDSYCGITEKNILECGGNRDLSCDLETNGVGWMSCGHDLIISGELTTLCGSEHTCTQRCGDWQKQGGCQCDRSCRLFNDCCADYKALCENTEPSQWPETVPFPADKFDPEDYSCIITGNSEFIAEVLLIDSCEDPTVGENTIRLCEDPYNITDLFASTPVYNADGIHFKNVFCAICRGNILEEITPWDVVLYYVGDPSFLAYDPIFERNVPDGRFYLPRIPQEKKPRTCTGNIQNTCDDLYVNTTYGQKCGQYYAPITFTSYFERPTYQNPDCRNCLGHARYLDPPFEAGYCITGNYRCPFNGNIPCRLFAPLRVVPDRFVSLGFDYNRLDGYARRAGVTCDADEVYDPFLGTCRILKCPIFFENVGSKCVPSEVPLGQQLEVRLTGGDDRSGRVEISHMFEWYSACGEYFNANVSRVLCRQLGFDHFCTSTVGRSLRYFVLPDQEPYTVGLKCTGEEDSIDECEKYFTFDNLTICNPQESEVIVTCGNTEDVRMRLVGTALGSEGFLQIRCNSGGEWAYVHGSDLHWDNREGKVVCRKLGYETFAFVDRRSKIEEGVEVFPVVEREIYCDSSSSNLLSCPFQLVSPDEEKYAWVSCGFRENVFDENLLFCGTGHTCRGRCGSWRSGCSCDALCTYFNDCCFDYNTYCKPDKEGDSPFSPFPDKIENDRYECMNYLNNQLQVVALCSPFWTKDQVQADCETRKPLTDIMAHMPVYDNNGVVYFNVYCALCNDVSPGELSAYPLLLQDSRNNTVTSINEDNIDGLLFGGVELPMEELGQARTCLLETNTCSPDVLHKCDAYYAPVYARQLVRNPSCLACGRDLDGYCTVERCQDVPNDEPCKGANSRSTILDLFDFSFSNTGKDCENVGHVFDPFLKTCRFVGCPKGFYYTRGVCEEGELPYNSPQVVLNKMISESIDCVNTLLEVNANEISALYVAGIKTNDSSTGPFSVTVISESLLASFSLKITLDHLLLSSSGRINVFYSCGVATFLLTASRTVRNVSDELCMGDEISFNHAPDVSSETEFFQNIFSYEFSQRWNEFIRHDLSYDCWNELNPQLECQSTAIVNPGEFDLNASRNSALILLNGVEVGTEEFQMLRNGSIRVCSHKLQTTSEIYKIAYTVCIVISLVAMLLTFVTYQTFPKLRNVPGLCLMNLLAALFVANFIFLFNDDFSALPEVCVGMAAISHFTWLASFAWMSVLSYNTARTFGTNSMQLSNSGNPKNRLMKYALFAWGLPFLIMAAGLALHFCDCTEGFVFQYGGSDTCWITDGLAVFFSVGVPVGIMLTFDLIVFLYTGVSLRRSRHAVKRMRIKIESSNDYLVELAVNIRLFILLGITWIFGFVQYLWPVLLWKVVFLVSNSLQGLFIFIMFVMKKRVLKMWLDLFSTCRIEEQTPTTKAVEDIQKPSNVPAVISQL